MIAGSRLGGGPVEPPADDAGTPGSLGRRFLTVAIALAWFAVQIGLSLDPTAVPAVEQRALHLGFALLLAGFVLAGRSRSRIAAAAWIVAGSAGAAVEAYALREMAFQVVYGGLYESPDLLVAVAGIVILLIVTGRLIGWVLPVLGVVLLVLPMVGDRLPSILRMASSDPSRLLNQVWFGNDGVHGVPLDASNRYIFVFIVFGTFLTVFGAGDFLMRVVRRALARARGGAGKMSVAASALFGLTSDSSAANVTTTGVVTIPVMKRSGFSADRAAGIEAAGSVGGLLVPPVMGSVAFIMAGLTAIPYHEIALAAAVPAVLYYATLYLAVDRVAARDGIRGVPAAEPPVGFRQNLLDAIEYVGPLAILVHLLVVARWEPSQAAGWALVLLVAIHLVRHRSVEAVKDCLRAAVLGPQRAVVVAIITAAVGTLVGPILISGLGLNLVTGLVSVGGGSLALLLALTVAASVVLGSGLPASATYVLLAVLLAPSLVELGVPLLAAHMFLMYLGNVADLSPPTMATVYVASGIAEARPMRTSGYAMLFGIGGLVVPLLFVFRPELLLVGGEPLGLLASLAVAAVVLYLIVSGTIGYARGPRGPATRCLLVALGLAGVSTHPWVFVPALVLGSAVALLRPGPTPPRVFSKNTSEPVEGNTTP
ncbi:TRAP transporter permease [Pseudonocardia thermophila]|uniref:TRAP transporter permease n=1 Tax=Pseudonocardia thermophila TaxID=1848 RepID=UPI00248DCEDC|nr:TRAP transporter fused permease subunit [Pseudonocardia thermophila]